MQSNTQGAVRHTRLTVIFVSLLIILLLGAFVLVLALGTRSTDEKEAILAKIEAAEERVGSGVADYIYRFGIRDFERTKLNTVELYYRANYYTGSIPSSLTLAKETARMFVESHYDTLDLADKDAVTAALAGCFISAVGDRYGIYRLPEEYEDYDSDMSGEHVGIGVEVRLDYTDKSLLVTRVIAGAPAEAAGIRSGDLISAVDGRSTEEIGLGAVADAIRGVEGTEVKITVLREGASIEFTIIRRPFTEHTVNWSVDNEKIAYIEITGFKANTDEQLKAALIAIESAGARGIVFDLRDNPGGYLTSVLNAIELLVPSGMRMASYKYANREEEVFTSAESDRVNIPIVVLCNEGTASAGELFTAAIRDFAASGVLTARVVGETTYGKGVMQTTATALLGGAALTYTVAYYNPPSNENYEGVGITPDRIVAGKTEQLAAAMEEISALIANQGLQN